MLPIAEPTEVRADFPADPASAGRARRFVDATLREWECDGMVDVAALLVSELVANAVLHAGTPIGVVVRRDSHRLRIEVHDDDPRAPARKHYSSMATTGRGIMLVERLAADWGVRATATGKGVWFELDESTPAGAGSSAAADLPPLDLDSFQPLGPGGSGPGPRGTSGGARRPAGGPSNRVGPDVRSRLVRAGP